MRVKQPEPFDPNREYRPGERCVYRGMVLIAEIWTAADARLANNTPAIFMQRCVRCKIKREDCPGIGRQCDKFHRSDRKTIYWRLLRIVGGFKGVETLEFNYNGTIAGVKVEAAPVCLAIKEMKGGTEYSNPRGTQHYFRCSNGRYENGIGQ